MESVPTMRNYAIYVLILFATIGASAARAQTNRPNFNLEVRPILSQHCFKCHGPDDGQRKAGLRLDQRSGALLTLASGHKAIVPGKSQESALVKRISSTGSDIMPPAYAN